MSCFRIARYSQELTARFFFFTSSKTAPCAVSSPALLPATLGQGEIFVRHALMRTEHAALERAVLENDLK
jgi:hypothetical protein